MDRFSWLPGSKATIRRRRLNDRGEFQVYKVFYEPAELAVRLNELGWQFDVRFEGSWEAPAIGLHVGPVTVYPLAGWDD